MKSSILEPKLSKDLTPLSEDGFSSLLGQRDIVYGDCSASLIERENDDWKGSDWNGCVFEKCRFLNLQSSHSYFDNVVFDGCDFSNADFSECGFRKVRFVGCKLIGASFLKSHFQDVEFSDSICRFSIFSESEMKRVRFHKDILFEVSMDAVKGKEYVFSECDLTRSDFRGTSLSGLDLRDSEISGISLIGWELKGAIVMSYQALELTRLLGVDIRD